MGNMKDLMGMIPGMGKAIKDIDIDDDAFKHIEAMINSMTLNERQQPDIINGSRRKRIAMGSGRSVQDVNNLLKQFGDMRKMMKMMQSGGGQTRNDEYDARYALKNDLMVVLDGNSTSAQIRAELAEKVKVLKAEGKKVPHLAAILVGEDSAASERM